MSNQTQPSTAKSKLPNAKPQKRTETEAREPETNAAPPRGPTHEQIARRAYELWVQHGQQHGRSEEDWLQAERDLKLGRY